MSHWAEINSENIVLRVLVGDNNEADEGKAFMESLGGRWVKTSYNARIRGKFAAIGDFYDEENDIFVSIPTQEDIELQKKLDEAKVKRQAILDRLGLTEEEARLLLG